MAIESPQEFGAAAGRLAVKSAGGLNFLRNAVRSARPAIASAMQVFPRGGEIGHALTQARLPIALTGGIAAGLGHIQGLHNQALRSENSALNFSGRQPFDPQHNALPSSLSGQPGYFGPSDLMDSLAGGRGVDGRHLAGSEGVVNSPLSLRHLLGGASADLNSATATADAIRAREISRMQSNLNRSETYGREEPLGPRQHREMDNWRYRIGQTR